jgi:DNA processing protein
MRTRAMVHFSYMDFPIRTVSVEETFPSLMEIPEAPVEMYVRGELPPRSTKCLAVVGSRNYSNYGKQVVDYLVGGLRGYPITIVSGLAIGIDGLAHRAALDSGLYTLAVPGSGIDDSVLYPRQHRGLAHTILTSGGGLLSEFPPTLAAAPWTFPKRNRIMAGLSNAVLLIEAGEKSGTLITARMTVDYNRDLLVVPGNIFSANSKGAHQFLKLGATPVTTPEDILIALGIDTEPNTPSLLPASLSDEEQAVLALLTEPKDNDTIIRLLPYPSETTLMLLMRMELEGYIREQNGVFSKLI